MMITSVPFGTTDWARVPATEHPGTTGTATWRTRRFGDVRVRVVDYSPGYLADHWCDKGHILLVLEGTLTTELAGGGTVTLEARSSYQVGDDTEAHRSSTVTGARLFIVD
ncbi:DHCW motif cupin fold protein [Longispora sp. NPDC051575]|uniref:DHCW motif cupin fold protein n=1 Tax=Longispora sp. NPDC051575 TaxID=3154943 RepID=UPI00341BD452